jgi:hypothetical protein
MYFYVLFSLSAFSFRVSNSVTHIFITTNRLIAVTDIEDYFQITSSKPSLVLVRFHEVDSSHPWYDILDSSRITNPDKLKMSIYSAISTHHQTPAEQNVRAAFS